MIIENNVFNETYRAFTVEELKSLVFYLGWHSDEYPNVKTQFVHQLLYDVNNTPGKKAQLILAAGRLNQSYSVTEGDVSWGYYTPIGIIQGPNDRT